MTHPSMHSVWAQLDKMRDEHREKLDWFQALACSIRRTSVPRCRASALRPWRVWVRLGRARELVLVTGIDPAQVLAEFEQRVEQRRRGARA